ncbi:MAG: hypothetical protein R3287_13015, partial [Anderseniella sp.]|nr:hypothetical protein [Anderseniella sp.]
MSWRSIAKRCDLVASSCVCGEETMPKDPMEMALGQIAALSASQLRLATDPASLNFGTTSEIEPLGRLLGQDRA